MKKTDLVVYGAGGMGREVMWLIESNPAYNEKYNILGYVDDLERLQGASVNNRPVVGDTSWLLAYQKEIAVAIAVGSSVARKNIFEKISCNKNIIFPNFIADNVIVSEYVKIGKGCIICSNCVLTVNIEIGDFLLSNLNCIITHDSKIGDFVTLNPSVNISGNVNLGDCTNIGTGTKIIQSKTVGKGTIIGAGAVVVRDIPANCTAVGVPAKPIKFH